MSDEVKRPFRAGSGLKPTAGEFIDLPNKAPHEITMRELMAMMDEGNQIQEEIQRQEYALQRAQMADSGMGVATTQYIINRLTERRIELQDRINAVHHLSGPMGSKFADVGTIQHAAELERMKEELAQLRRERHEAEENFARASQEGWDAKKAGLEAQSQQWFHRADNWNARLNELSYSIEKLARKIETMENQESSDEHERRVLRDQALSQMATTGLYIQPLKPRVGEFKEPELVLNRHPKGNGKQTQYTISEPPVKRGGPGRPGYLPIEAIRGIAEDHVKPGGLMFMVVDPGRSMSQELLVITREDDGRVNVELAPGQLIRHWVDFGGKPVHPTRNRVDGTTAGNVRMVSIGIARATFEYMSARRRPTPVTPIAGDYDFSFRVVLRGATAAKIQIGAYVYGLGLYDVYEMVEPSSGAVARLAFTSKEPGDIAHIDHHIPKR